VTTPPLTHTKANVKTLIRRCPVTLCTARNARRSLATKGVLLFNERLSHAALILRGSAGFVDE
jgi:hypothetical protein